MRTCVWQRSPSMFRALWSQLYRSTAARAVPTADMSDMILSLHFVYSPAILLYIINNIMLLKRSIMAKSTVCTDIFNNMYNARFTVYCVQKALNRRSTYCAYAYRLTVWLFVCDHCSAIQPHCECGSVCFRPAMWALMPVLHLLSVTAYGHIFWWYFALRAPNTFFVFHFSDPLSIIIRKVDLAFFEFSPYIEIILFCYSILRYCYENHLNR